MGNVKSKMGTHSDQNKSPHTIVPRIVRLPSDFDAKIDFIIDLDNLDI